MDAQQPKYLPLYKSLAFKLGLCAGLITLVSILTLAFFAIKSQRSSLTTNMFDEAVRFSETLTNSMKHSMWKYDVEGIDSIVQTVGKQKGIANVRIFSHTGEVRFSTDAGELGRQVDKKAEACYVCHSESRPFHEVDTKERRRIYAHDGERVLGMITPIYNERDCFNAECHVHGEKERVLGVLDVGVSLAETDRTISKAVRNMLLFSLSLFVVITVLLGVALFFVLGKPVRSLVEATQRISRGEYDQRLTITSSDDLGELAQAFNLMSERIRDREDALERSREEYKTLFENVPTYVAVVDRNFQIVQANRNFRETFGDLEGDHCFLVYKGLDGKCKDCPVEIAFKTKSPQFSEECGKSKDGEEIHYLVYVAPIMDENGEPLYAIEMSVDLTKIRLLEKELQASREFLNNLVENSIHGIAAVDESGKIIIFNRAAERILGYPAPDVMGSGDYDRLFPRSFARIIHAAFEGKASESDLKIVAQETTIVSKLEERIPVRFSGVILQEDEETVGAVGFFQDLRFQKTLEREKRQAERLGVVGQTVASLAHGIKNIITGLEGGVYVIQTAMNRKDDALLQKGWGMVERNIDKISSLVKDLLNYSKVTVTEIQRVKPNELAEEIHALFREKAEQSNIELIFEPDPALDEADMDPKAVHTCLANLLSNALDACIDDEEKSEHRVVLRTFLEKSGVVAFEVEDNAMGMDETVREKLFNHFFTTKGTKGTGLGLMVTHKLVHEHGGEITLDTKPGEGSTFRIRIPQEGEESYDIEKDPTAS